MGADKIPKRWEKNGAVPRGENRGMNTTSEKKGEKK